MLPSTDSSIIPFDCRKAVFNSLPTEEAYFPDFNELGQDVTLLALQIGETSRHLRASLKREVDASDSPISDNVLRHEDSTRIEETWDSVARCQNGQIQIAQYFTNGRVSLPPLAKTYVYYIYLNFRSCLIYKHTSMFPGQLKYLSPSSDEEVSTCAKKILEAARYVTLEDHFSKSSLVLPVFVAGVASKVAEDKTLALDYMKSLELGSCEGGIENARRMLESIYQKQHLANMQFGDATSVDWVEEIERSGKPLFLFGMLQAKVE